MVPLHECDDVIQGDWSGWYSTASEPTEPFPEGPVENQAVEARAPKRMRLRKKQPPPPEWYDQDKQ